MKYLYPLACLAVLGIVSLGAAQIPLTGVTGNQQPLKLASGWTVVQNNIQNGCTAGSNTCSFAACTGGANTECIAPTVAGSSWIVAALTANNVTISSVTGGGGTWSLCPSSQCHGFDSGLGNNSDLAYNLSGTTATQTFTVNLSGNSSGYFVIQFAEVLPPTGYTASFDVGGNHADTGCTTSCAVASVSLSATDFVLQCCEFSMNPWHGIGGKPWDSPYLTSPVGNGIGLNIPAGTTSPAVAMVNGTGTGFVSSTLALKSSAGPFIFTGSTNLSLVQYTLPTNTGAGSAGQVNCTPACPALTAFSSTGSGNLLVLIEGDTGSSHRNLSSITDNQSETWTVPTGAGSCGLNAGVSCAYVLSSTAGVTSITPTLAGTTGGASAGFSLWEFHRTTGSWTLDCQGAKTQTGVTLPVSPTITCTGTNDVVIAAVAGSGGVSGMTYGMMGDFPGAALNLKTSSPFDPSNAALINTTNFGPYTFPFENGGSFSSNSIAVAFQ
jgi:hypothetical protein